MKEIDGQRYPDYVVEDKLTPVSIENADVPAMLIGLKYDYIAYHEETNSYMLKVLDDEKGLITMWLDEATAGYLQAQTGIEIMHRRNLTVSEYAGFISARASTQLDDSWLEGEGRNPLLDE